VLFGKLPSHGDFVARGIGAMATERWDGWMAEGLDAARSALGYGFDDAHGAAPPWRFVRRDPEGAWSAGVLAPSMDLAGRRFLLLLAVEDLDLAQAGALGAGTAERMEGVLYAAFAEGLDADAAHARAAQVAEEAALSAPAADLLRAEAARSVWWTLGGAAHTADAVAADEVDGSLLVRMLTPAGAQATAWREAAA
jgi:type VI secretion system protein ImpM